MLRASIAARPLGLKSCFQKAVADSLLIFSDIAGVKALHVKTVIISNVVSVVSVSAQRLEEM